MFKSDANGGAETVIGPTVHVEGDFKSQGNVQIEGSLTGSVSTSGNLTVGREAKIKANIQAANAFVAGYIKGNLTVSERLELTASSRVDGDITTKVLVVAEGAQLNGRCQMGVAAAAPIAAKVNGKKPAQE